MKMPSSRGLLLSPLLLRSISAHRSAFNSAFVSFSVAADGSAQLYDHLLNTRRRLYCACNNSSKLGVDQDTTSHLLTASDFAAAIGFFPRYRELLWFQKINGTTDTSNAMDPYTKMTISYKDRAFDAYMNISKMRPYFIARPDLQVYDKNPLYGWMAASVDGIIDNKSCNGHGYEYPRSILKIVCTYDFDLYMDRASVEVGHVRFPDVLNEHKKTPWKRIPLCFIPQVQGIMEVMGMDKIEFYVWGLFSGSSLFSIYRDAEYCDILKTALSDFWWKHVFPAKELRTKHKTEYPFYQLQSLKPAPKHEFYHYIVQESKRIADKYEAIQIDANQCTLPI